MILLYMNLLHRQLNYFLGRMFTESNQTMQNVLLMYLQANLPKGIENIRPHLENIDNVPLLVSLFTDCTAESK